MKREGKRGRKEEKNSKNNPRIEIYITSKREM